MDSSIHTNSQIQTSFYDTATESLQTTLSKFTDTLFTAKNEKNTHFDDTAVAVEK